MRRKPEGHSLYWAYAYDAGGGSYDFDTSPRKDEIYRLARDFLNEPWVARVYIFWGDDSGAFTHLDPVETLEAK